VNGIELNFISLLHKFKIYIQGEMLLPKILVRNQIRIMLGGETSKITFGRINYNLGPGAKEFRLCTIYWYSVRVRTSRLSVLSL